MLLIPIRPLGVISQSASARKPIVPCPVQSAKSFPTNFFCSLVRVSNAMTAVM